MESKIKKNSVIITIDLQWYNLLTNSNLKTNDIVVFENQTKQYETKIVKRCIAKHGQKIKINHNDIYIDDIKQNDNENITYSYNYDNDENMNMAVTSIRSNTQHFSNFEFSKLKEIQQNHFHKNEEKKTNYFIYPQSDVFNWNRDNFGPIIVPYKGYTIKLNAKNIAKYIKIITKYEDPHFSVIPVSGNKVSSYTFMYDYWFMLGDNRHNSIDSRYYGFIPEHDIIDKVILSLPL